MLSCVCIHCVFVKCDSLQPVSLFNAGAIIALFLVFIFFMPLLLWFVYIVSFGFNKFETAQGVLPLILTWVSSCLFVYHHHQDCISTMYEICRSWLI